MLDARRRTTMLLCLLATGCGSLRSHDHGPEQGPGFEAGAGDAGPSAAGALDAGAPDAGDAGPEVPDASVIDAGVNPITLHGVSSPDCPDEQAVVTSFNVPTKMDTNALRHATVTVTNTGTATWTRAAEYRLGSPDDSDPFMENARVELAPGDAFGPGQSVTFTVDLRAPELPGSYSTDWRMVHDGMCWFGDQLTLTIEVAAPVATGVCANPTPSGLDVMTAVVHIVGPTRITLDSTPKVCDRDYCAQIGFTDGRTCCPPRPEGHPDVDVCNEAIVGHALDTGRVGPTWTFNGQPCGPSGPGDCTNHPTNQFLLFVYGPGTARACGNLNGVCGEVVVP